MYFSYTSYNKYKQQTHHAS